MARVWLNRETSATRAVFVHRCWLRHARFRVTLEEGRRGAPRALHRQTSTADGFALANPQGRADESFRRRTERGRVEGEP